MPQSLEVYAFSDRKDDDGLFPVVDVQGAVVARIRTSFWNRDFSATTIDGSPLCLGTTSAFSRTYEVVDGGGRALFVVRSGFWSGRRRQVVFPDGVEYELRGDGWLSRDWSVSDAAGRVALRLTNTASFLAFHPDQFAVEVADERLTLAHVVGVVEVNRLLVKSARANSGG